MQTKTGAILLVAGTCIGSGMIALPMVLAKLGLIPSSLLMLFIWYVMYHTSLINLELNLQANQGLSLGSLGKHFSGKGAEMIGLSSLKILSFSLLAVFIYGGSSVLQELIKTNMSVEYSLNSIATVYMIGSIGLLLLPLKLIDYINRVLLVGLLAIIAFLIVGLVLEVNWNHLPLFSQEYNEISLWVAVIPVVFTSFGYQVIFHTLTNYCNKDAKMLKQAFLWGSLIPAIVYILWTCSVLSVVHNENPLFYQEMASGKAEVGELIQVLSSIAKWESVQLFIWWISILAVTTSVLGVGVGLCQAINEMLAVKVPYARLRKLIAAPLTILPAYLVVIYVPNAFITVLGFAGMILAVIAILLPTYLFWKIKTEKLYYGELKAKSLISISVIVGILVVLSELFNMM